MKFMLIVFLFVISINMLVERKIEVFERNNYSNIPTSLTQSQIKDYLSYENIFIVTLMMKTRSL